MRIRILVDLLHIRDSVFTGIGNVALDIVKGLIEYTEYEVVVLIWENLTAKIDEDFGNTVLMISMPLKYQKDLKKRFSIHFIPLYLRKKIECIGIDLVFTPRFSVNSYIFPRKYKQIGLVHDVQHVKLRKWHVSFPYYMLLTALYYHMVPHLISISKFTQKDVRLYSGRDSIVIYNSVTIYSNKEKRIEEFADIKYILDVNSFWKYKNTERLIDAFSLIMNEIPHKLYLKGTASDIKRKEELETYVKNRDLSDRVVIDINNYSLEEMNYLYNHADLFVSPSLMEGFGLTPIEAALHKIPVLISNIETLKEVTDEKVGMFNPLSAEDMAKSILDILLNPLAPRDLDELAKYYQEKYSRKNQIRCYTNYFKKIVGENG